ncbi:MAG: OmpA family protein [Alcanivoracaceae bacterium]
MKKVLRTVLAGLCLAVLGWPALVAADSSIAQYRQIFGSVDRQLAAAQEAQADVLSPDRFARAMRHYKDADNHFHQRRNPDAARQEVARAQSWLNRAMETTQISAVAFSRAVQNRKNALSADAPTHAADIWRRAEDALRDATRRVEGGDIRRAEDASRTVAELYQQAELQAIKTNYLSGAHELMRQAKAERADRHAIKTYIDAKLLLQQAERELTENRYDTDYPRDLARRARNEAQHAITISRLAIGVARKDFAVEDIITNYEKPLIAIADDLNIVPALHEGYEPTRDAIRARIAVLQKESQELAQMRLLVEEQSEEIARLSEQLGIKNEQLAAEERYQALLAELESIFRPEEAEIFRQGKNMIIRMVGLNFASGKHELTTEHMRLLAKVVYAIQISRTELTSIEGHTDSHGADAANLVLSEQRAQAVVDYLKGDASLANAVLMPVGYGEARPIANNESELGRQKNRRIDVVIQLERERVRAAPAEPAEDDTADADAG